MRYLVFIFLSNLFILAQAQENQKFEKLILNHYPDLQMSDIGDFRITKNFKDSHNGVLHAYGVQVFENMDIHPAYFDMHLKDGKLVSMHQNFVNLSKINIDKNESLSASECLNAVLKFAEISPKSQNPEIHHFSIETTREFSLKNPAWSSETISGKKMWLVRGDKLEMVWRINILLKSGEHWWNLYVSANNGEILEKSDWIVNCQIAGSHTNHNHGSQDPGFSAQQTQGSAGTYFALPIPAESPNHGTLTSINNPSDSIASPFGWHDTNGATGAEYTITRGNNVFAREDIDNNDLNGYSPNGGSSLNFTANFDINKPASDFLDASIINLFYMNNIMHDVWYRYGFNEESGNFQENNYGKSGDENDFVFADAQDGSGTNNANFGTPEDGQNPRMQMYIWKGGAAASQLIRVNTPSSIAGKYSAVQAGFTPQLTTTAITSKLVLISSKTSSSEGCDSVVNAAALKNNIVLIDRGTCTFVEKIQRAQAAGALAVIIVNNTGSAPFSMGGTSSGITIPAVMISQADGATFKSKLANNPNLSLYDSTGSTLRIFDSDFDNGVIAHEYGHGISNRLTGGALNSNCLTNQEQMGEGWSDFFALVMTHEPADKGTDSRGIGTYVAGESINGGGIRTYPYSTDRNISKYTYNDIKTLSVPHGVGSVWSAMLWDMYWAFIDVYGYDSDIYNGTGGNQKAMQLVIDGLKLQPCSPGFVDGRDAILLADQLNNKGKNQLLIWQVFAARGLGYSASQGSSSSRSDGIEGYDIPPTLFNKVAVSKSTNPEILSNEFLNYKVVLRNETPNVLYEVTFNDTLSSDVNFISVSGCPLTFNGVKLFMTLDSMNAGDSMVCNYQVKTADSKFSTLKEMDSLESGLARWKIQSDLGSNLFNISNSRKSGGNSSVFISNATTQSDQSLIGTYKLDSMENPALIFDHFYNTEETWDGAVVEISEKGTSDWEDAADYFIKGGYNRTIETNPESTISGRRAFTGNSYGFVNSIVDLTKYKGKEIDVRFRFASDGAAGEEGWYLDNIGILDLHYVYNKAEVVTKGGNPSSSEVLTVVYKGKSSVSLNNLNTNNEIKIYPNPFSSIVSIELGAIENGILKIFDASGRLIIEQSIERNSFNLDLSGWDAGVYNFSVKSKNSTVNYKVIKL